MVLADKAERTELVKNWEKFQDLKADPKIGNLASLLAEGHPFCLCKEVLILAYNFTKLRNKANIIENQAPIQNLVALLLGRKVKVYAIDPNEKNTIMKKFFNLQTIGMLPSKLDIQLNINIQE